MKKGSVSVVANLRMVLLLVVVGLASCLGFLPRAHAEGRLQDLQIEQDPRLGLSFPGNALKYYNLMAQAGIGTVRLSVPWKYREKRPGRFDWGGLDKKILRLQSLGIDPFLTFESKSDWGVFKDTAKRGNGTPKDIEQWKNFVFRATERYDGDGRDDAPGLLRPVRYFQTANEWISASNPAGGWGRSTSELIAFMNATYDAVKAASPQAVVVLGGIASHNLDVLAVYERRADYDIRSTSRKKVRKTVTFEEIRQSKLVRSIAQTHIYPVLKGARYDAVDLHLYGPVDRDPVRIAMIRDLAPGRILLSSECGGPSLDYVDEYRPRDHFFAVMERFLVIFSEGLEFCAWFRLGESGGSTYGNSKVALFTGKGKKKPGYHAFQLLAALFKDVVRVEHKGPQQHYRLHRKTGSPVLVAWSEGPAAQARLRLPEGMENASVVRVTDPVAGIYRIDSARASGSVALNGELVIVADPLPAAFPAQ